MPSDIAENDYLSRVDCDKIRETLEKHKELHESEGHIPERDDTYAFVEGEDGWEVEVTHSSHRSIIHVVPDEVDGTQLENEVTNVVANSSVDGVDFDHRNSKLAAYEHDYS